MDVFEKYAAKRKLAFGLKESMLLGGLFGGVGGGLYGKEQGLPVAGSAIKGTAGGLLGAYLSEPIWRAMQRKASWSGKAPLLAGALLADLAPYYLATRFGNPRRS